VAKHRYDLKLWTLNLEPIMPDNFKNILQEHCKGVVKRKIESIGFFIGELNEALEQETKSTVGDKHETARAKIQSEQASLGWQMEELKGFYKELERVNTKRTFEQIDYGSLIETDNTIFYLTIPLGKIDVEGKTVFVISQFSPIGQKFMGLKINDQFNFNGTFYRIKNIS
jgi:hypothetical protein